LEEKLECVVETRKRSGRPLAGRICGPNGPNFWSTPCHF